MAKTEQLSDAKLRKMKRPDQETTLRDTSGVQLRLFTSGRKTFGWRFVDKHRNGSRSRIEYGDYPDLSLDSARQIHRLMMAARQNGKDIMTNAVRAEIYSEVLGESAPVKPVEGMTFSAVYRKYMLEYIQANNIDERSYKRIKNHVLPVLGDFVVDNTRLQVIKDFVVEFRKDNSETGALSE